MKVFVTGATGFIGRHLAERLVREGHTVRCLVRSTSQVDALKQLGLELVVGDVRDTTGLAAAMRGVDCFFHLANLYAMWLPQNRAYGKVNVEGTRNAFEAALEANVGRVVYVSTAAVFGRPEAVPFNEDSVRGEVLFSEYARTKAEGERIAWDYARRGLDLCVLYPGIVLGVGDHKASGQYIRDIIHGRVPSTIFHQSRAIYVHVEDVVDAAVQAALRPEVRGRGYLIGGQCLNGRDYARLIAEISQVRLPILHFPDEIVLLAAYLLTGLSALTHRPPWWGLSIDAAQTLKQGFVFDGSRAERELGLSYRPIRQALEEAIQSYSGKGSRF